ncbi:MAG: type II toxin-antitoxin system YafQ family toxin [Anaerolineaceae bacterium]|nr:type II toxin-antitoxin system YafQ family toxin [Anaerolineaceae bacterium]
MKTLLRTSTFKKDLKRMQKRGKAFSGLKHVIQLLLNAETLDPKYRDHSLTGNYSGTRECHIEPDWLLIYESDENQLILIRTGTHADLFR